MLDARLASALLQAVPSKAHLLLVGDTDQLPSVGAGNVLKDLIAASAALEDGRWQMADGKDGALSRSSAAASGSPSPISHLPSPNRAAIPVTRLSVIYRQKEQSGIVLAAHAINSGDPSLPPTVNDLASVQAWSDLTFIAATDADDCLRKVTALCTEGVPRLWKWFDPVNDVQVLAPMHKGVAGVANLNAALQAALNPEVAGALRAPVDRARSARPTLRTASGEYRPGDKVIQLRNNYDKNLFNGDIGTVTAIDATAGTLEANFDGERHTFDRGEFGDLALAYAISIHKSQGSEYPVVIIPLLKGHFMMLQRNLLYTAITRGRKKVLIVGEPAAYAMAVRNSESKQRVTHLREKVAQVAGT